MLRDGFEIIVGRKQLVAAGHGHDGDQTVGSRCTEPFHQTLVPETGGVDMISSRREYDRERGVQPPLQLGELLLRTHTTQDFLKNDAWKAKGRICRHQAFDDKL